MKKKSAGDTHEEEEQRMHKERFCRDVSFLRFLFVSFVSFGVYFW